MKLITQDIEVGGKSIQLEYGRFAEQASSAVMVRSGDTTVFVSVVAAPAKLELDYFPLTVDYMERLYAGGKIKGSRWVKREGRPSDEEILTSRLIDRSIRPLFPKTYKKEVQVVAMALSVDSENDPKILAMIGASAALSASTISWKGPVGSLKIGHRDTTYMANPTDTELDFSDLDLVLTANKEAIFMLEAGARELPEEKVLEAIAFGQKEAQKIITGIEEFAKKVGKEKEVYDDIEHEDVLKLVDEKFGEEIEEVAKANASKEFGGESGDLKERIAEALGEEKASLADYALEKVTKKRIRSKILSGERMDGRKHDEVREITAEVGILPRTHGSAMFKRGQTQVMSVATLGSPQLGQLIETAEGEEEKRYMHFYNFPPYSTGETGRVGQPSRREIGHGALAERALIPVIPSKDVFPYTIQIVSEVMSSNGSTSMASTCGSTLSLMDAGVPILAPVAGIAMGLVIEDGNVAILSDIMGMEDGNGDMDFKVTGTEAGVTAIQMDVKTSSLTLEILSEALTQARVGRMHILGKMLEALGETRTQLSTYAPKIVVVKVPVEKIGEVIGPGGRVIKKIMAETGAQVDVEDDGSVTITGVNGESMEAAKGWIEGLVKEVEPGEIYEGEVMRIQPFGAFVQVLPGKDGLVHVSDMAEDFVQDPNDIVKVGDKVTVRVKEVDDLGRVNLSMRMDPSTDAPRHSAGKPREERGGGERRFGGGDRGPRRDDRGPRRDDRGPRHSGGDRDGGPHFPASRFLPRDKKGY